MIAAVDVDVWGAIAIVLAALVSAYVAYRQARIGAASDREARLAEMADKTIERQDAKLDKVQSRLDDLTEKHQACLDNEAKLRIELRHLKDRVDELATVAEKAEHQRKLKHDWRSFAGSLYLERETSRRYLREGRIEDAVRLLDHNDELRTGSPLLDDVEDLIRRDEP